MKRPFIAFHPLFELPLPEGHRFPMQKYALLPEQLLYEGIVTSEDFFEPEVLDLKYVHPPHDSAYVSKLLNEDLNAKEIRRLGFPLTHALIERELRIARGTVMASLAAFDTGIGFNIAGGTHHAGSNWGEGFCLLNDQAIAARYLLHYYHLKKILIVDLDVHQGNGTAEIFEKDKDVFTFSIHGKNNFPFEKEKSDWDIGLQDGICGKKYLNILNDSLKKLIKHVRPDFIFYQAGADVLATDKLGKMKLSIEECRQRDKLVFEYCKRWNVPVQVSMGGGYSSRINPIVDAHCNTFKVGIEILKE